MSYENEALWYVVHTYSGYENKVAENIAKIVENRGLSNLIFETKIPLEVVEDIPEEEEQTSQDSDAALEDDYTSTSLYTDYFDEKDMPARKKKSNKAKKPEEHKLFPSYVLVKMIMNDETWHVVRNITGVTGFVGPGSKPVPLTEEEVAALGVDVVVRKIDLQPGDSVFIVSGVLAGDVGTVKEVDQENRRIKVNVMFGGRETAVDMDVAEVEKLKD